MEGGYGVWKGDMKCEVKHGVWYGQYNESQSHDKNHKVKAMYQEKA